MLDHIKASWDKGVHSNIPKCCIVWFFIRWRTYMWPVMHNKRLHQLWVRLQPDEIPPEEHQYVRCPICALRGHYSKMHICDESCFGVKGECRSWLLDEEQEEIDER